MAGSSVSGRRGGSPYGGFDYKFVGAVDDFICSICTKVLREPHLTVCCGQHYCSSCLKHWEKTRAKPTMCLSTAGLKMTFAMSRTRKLNERSSRCMYCVFTVKMAASGREN